MNAGEFKHVKMSDVRVGTLLVADGDFTCLNEGEIVEVKHDERGLFVPCSEGHHYLDGQISGNRYIGLAAVNQGVK